MGVLSALQTSQKRDPSGAPFATGSAFNGLSVDTATGKIVLGQDFGDPALPAQLVSPREIPFGGSFIVFTGMGRIDIPPIGISSQPFAGGFQGLEFRGSPFSGASRLAIADCVGGFGNVALTIYATSDQVTNFEQLYLGYDNGPQHFAAKTNSGGAGTLRGFFIDTSDTNSGSLADASMFFAPTTKNIGVGGQSAPTARMHYIAGSATAGTAPWKYTSGPLLTVAEVGANEFLTDKAFLTITTGAARKEYTLNDIALTAGRVPFVTTNGRLTDNAALTFGTSANGQSLQISGSITSASPVAGFSLVQTWNNAAAAPIGLSMIITDTASQTFNSSLQRAVRNGVTVWNVRKDGALTTGDPGGGAGIWKLGEPTAGAVVLDLANYVEVEINGNIVKLLIST